MRLRGRGRKSLMLVGVLLFLVGLGAGFIDAIAGGGGLLTLPSLMLVPLDTPLALGTNKGQGVFGTAMSLAQYARSTLLDRRRALWSFVPALVGSALGVMTVCRVAQGVLTPLVMALLVMAAAAMIFQRPPAGAHAPRERSMLLAVLVAFVLAFYDGFFGPGTGTFLILAYAWLWRDALDAASANAKVVNFGSNLGAMLTFAARGLIVWKYALPMAAGQLLGGYLGAHATIRGGRQVVRFAVIGVSVALVARLGWRYL